MRKTIFLLLLCLAGAALNIILNIVFTASGMGLPIYLDTMLTVTVTFIGGPVWGCLTGALTNIIGHSINFWGWEGYLFTICSIATALITWLFIRLFRKELSFENHQNTPHEKNLSGSHSLNKTMNRIVVLILLSFSLCFAMSILGGSISAFIQIITDSPADEMRLKALLGGSMSSRLPLVLAEILSRIPVNIIDRLIAAFGGYGLALGINKFR